MLAVENLKLEGKYSLESTDPRESEIRAPSQPLPYLMRIPPKNALKIFITPERISGSEKKNKRKIIT